MDWEFQLHSYSRAPGGNEEGVQVWSIIRGVWQKPIWNSHLNSNSRVLGGSGLGFAFENESLGGMKWEFEFEGAWGNELGIQTWFEFKSEGDWEKSARNSNSNSNAPGWSELGIQIRLEFKGPWGKWSGNLNLVRIQTRECLGKMDWEFQLHSNSRTSGEMTYEFKLDFPFEDGKWCEFKLEGVEFEDGWI